MTTWEQAWAKRETRPRKDVRTLGWGAGVDLLGKRWGKVVLDRVEDGDSGDEEHPDREVAG